MKRILVFFVLIFLMGFALAGDKVIGVDFDEGDEVEVVVKLSAVRDFGLRAMSSSDVSNVPKYEVRTVTRRELAAMEDDEDVEKIFNKYYIRAYLSEAVGIVDSSSANSLSVSGLNLNGSGQTVCVVDSGVNFTHPDLLGKNASCIVDCFNKICVENCSTIDDHGHGTHVAGIIAASGGITGVAPNVSLIGVKILGSDGGGSGNNSDLENAVNYCVAQNATVISMSLGTVLLYDSNCDGIGGISGWRDAIDAAVGQNISVVVASGNDGNLTHISAPACLQNATAVGDTYDDDVGNDVSWGIPEICTDSTTALDQIVCHANRNSLVKLFAPGALINSTSYTGGYAQFGGTSMATPVVAASIALINQYLNISGLTRMPSEIEDVLNDSGVLLNDSGESNLTFSRINVYDALLSLDVDVPNVTLVSPVDNHVNSSVNHTFTCNATDWQLVNVTFRIWNSSELYYNETKNFTGTSNATSFVLTDMPEATYEWNCFVTDNQSNVGNASNYTLTVGGAEVELVSPVDNKYTNVEDTNFTCNSSSDSNYDLDNVTFYLWNSTGNLTYNLTRNISSFSNQSIFNYTLSVEDDYTWGCVAVNNNSDSGAANFTLYYDNTAPVITGLGSTVTDTTATLTWTTTEETNSSASVSGGSWTNSSDYETGAHSIVVSSLAPESAYTYTVTGCDRAGNCDVDTSNSFTTDAETVVTVTTSGGGDSDSDDTATNATDNETVNDSEEDVDDSPAVYSPTLDVLNDGYDKKVKKDERIKFRFLDSDVEHSVTIDYVGIDYVNLIVASDPVNVSLKIGEEVKLNLSSPDYYDLFIKLNNITDDEADLTVQTINEEINKEIDWEILKKIGIIIGGILVLGGFGLVIYFIIRNIDRKELDGDSEKEKGASKKGSTISDVSDDKSKAKKLKGSNTEKKNGRKDEKVKA